MTETTTEPTTSDEIRQHCRDAHEHMQTAMDAILNASIKSASLAGHKFNKRPLERIFALVREGKAHIDGAMSEMASVATNVEGGSGGEPTKPD